MKLVPDRIAPYAKAWVSLLGTLVTVVVTAAPAVPWWVGIIPALCTAIATYLVPNAKASPTGDSDDDAAEDTTVIEAEAGPIVPATPVKKATRKPRAPAAKKAAAKKSTPTSKEN